MFSSSSPMTPVLPHRVEPRWRGFALPGALRG
jgi:hypothetical protein